MRPTTPEPYPTAEVIWAARATEGGGGPFALVVPLMEREPVEKFLFMGL